jgi:hypothetical protein
MRSARVALPACTSDKSDHSLIAGLTIGFVAAAATSSADQLSASKPKVSKATCSLPVKSSSQLGSNDTSL